MGLAFGGGGACGTNERVTFTGIKEQKVPQTWVICSFLGLNSSSKTLRSGPDTWWLQRERLTSTPPPPSSTRGRQSGFSGAMRERGLRMVTVQFVFGSPLVAELRSEPKVKTHGEGQPDQRTTAQPAERRKRGNGNLCEEMD